MGDRQYGDVEVRIVDINSNTVTDLITPCRACVYWEYPERFDESFPEDHVRLKHEWFAMAAAQFGPCGKLLYVDDTPAGYCQYAGASFISGIRRYRKLMPQAKQDAPLITCLYICEEHQRKGLGRRLLTGVIDDLRDRGFGAVQTIGRDDSANNCSGPTRFYLEQGFSVVTTQHYPGECPFSLLRLEL